MKCIPIVGMVVLSLIGASVGTRSYAGQQQLILGANASVRDGSDAFTAMNAIGIKSVRFDVPWKQVEVKAGQYQIPDWVEATVAAAQAANMLPLAILDYGNPLYGNDKPKTPEAIEAFSRYAAFVVKHFKGRINHFELWNEWETHTGNTTPGSPEDYIALAKVAYPVIKASNPVATVLMNGYSGVSTKNLTGGWLDRFFQSGGLTYADAVSLHPYNQPGDEEVPEMAIRLIDQIHDMAAKVDSNKSNSIYVTEMGYTTFSGKYGVSEDQQAEYLARFILLAASRQYVKGVWWYSLQDGGVDPANKENHWGLFKRGFELKPAAQMYTNLSGLLGSFSSLDAKENGDNFSVVLRNFTGARSVSWRKGSGYVMTFADADSTHQSRLLDLNVLHNIPRAPANVRAR
jgi:hypothetical protein